MSDWLKKFAIETGTDMLRRVTGGIALAVGILLTAGLKHAWPDRPPGGLTATMIGDVCLAVAAVALGLPAAAGSVDPLLDFTPGQWRLVVGGLAVAFAFAVGLFAYQWHDQTVADAGNARRQADQDACHQQLRARSVTSRSRRPTASPGH